jgi:hypothetical protein
MGTATAPATSTVATGKLVSSFTSFAGSEANASALINGLRTGTPITLTSPTTASGTVVTTSTGSTPSGSTVTTTTVSGTASTGSSVTFTAPTKPMGYGNIRIALSLAQAQLAAQGITQPTPQQLQTALLGSTSPAVTAGGTTATTGTQGILQMRASGMGWGQVAQASGFKLGQVMSGRTGVTTAAGQQYGYQSEHRHEHRYEHKEHRSSGIVTAAGTSAQASGSYKHTERTTTTAGVTTASGASTHHRHDSANSYRGSTAGSGIVTAAGGNAMTAGSYRQNYGNASATTGVTTAAGSASVGIQGGKNESGGHHGKGKS